MEDEDEEPMIEIGPEQIDENPFDPSIPDEEYLKMIAAGLAGTSPHMISATITALSRVVFEFKGTLVATPSISISNYLHRNYIDHHAI